MTSNNCLFYGLSVLSGFISLFKRDRNSFFNDFVIKNTANYDNF